MIEPETAEFLPYSLAICGLPRSGTTWMHNAFIASGKWAGIPADDLSTEPSLPFATDENTTLHETLFKSELSADVRDIAAVHQFLESANQHWQRKDLLNKSPYFCFFLNSLYRCGAAEKIIFVKRSIDAVAFSMLRHPHIGNLLQGDFESAFDFARDGTNIETVHVDPVLLVWTRHDYHRLTKFDRALFKCLCFTSSFVAKASNLPKSTIRIADFDRLDHPIIHKPLFDWLMLSQAESSVILDAFRPTPVPSLLPDHSSDYALRIRGEIGLLWDKLVL